MAQAHAGPIRLLLESDADAVGGSEIFLATFDTYTDLVDFNLNSSTFSQLDIAPGFSVGGFTYQTESQSVSEPNQLALLGIGLLALSFMKRRRSAWL
ncbi:MAG: PEP-CTERM sorting domain-containing protein [Sedimenticola sp.]|nr:PEP-CTERM sorting domain-containing protein [Sedimenticola sp.]MCW8903543.1 PEP-CTERM sorting domain-containing protein [Sedimenticola sp.]